MEPARQFGVLDPATVDVQSDSFDGDTYDLDLALDLPRHRPVLDAGGALLLPTGFAMPGNQTYASGAHHREPFSLGMWSAATATVPRYAADGAWRADAMAAIWDGETNGPPHGFESTSMDVVSVWCMRSALRRGVRRYTAVHRYRMPVRQLIKGFRCPACTARKIREAREKRPGSPWATTMAELEHCARDWDDQLNWPVLAEQAPACSRRFYDMRCHACGTRRINFGDALAFGSDRRPPQGCPRCRLRTRSIIEVAVVQTLAHYRREGTTVEGSVVVAGKVVDALVRTDAARALVIEYDGAYWHRHTLERDTRMTERLLAHGVEEVIRLRAGNLPEVPGATNIRIPQADDIGETAVRALSFVADRHPDRFRAAEPDEARDFAGRTANRLATALRRDRPADR